jgi:hypothetical protein
MGLKLTEVNLDVKPILYANWPDVDAVCCLAYKR